MLKAYKLLVAMIFAVLICTNHSAQAQTYPRAKTDVKGSNVSVWIPRVVIGLTSFVLPQDKKVLRELFPDLKSLRVKVRNGAYYRNRFANRYNRQSNRLEKRNYKSIIDRDGKRRSTNLAIKRNRKGKIKKSIYLTNAKEGYTMIKVGGNVKLLPILKHIGTEHTEIGGLIEDAAKIKRLIELIKDN